MRTATHTNREVFAHFAFFILCGIIKQIIQRYFLISVRTVKQIPDCTLFYADIVPTFVNQTVRVNYYAAYRVSRTDIVDKPGITVHTAYVVTHLELIVILRKLLCTEAFTVLIGAITVFHHSQVSISRIIQAVLLQNFDDSIYLRDVLPIYINPKTYMSRQIIFRFLKIRNNFSKCGLTAF